MSDSINKRFNEQSNNCASAHFFFAVLYKTTTSKREPRRLMFLKFYLNFIAVSQIEFRDNFDRDKQSE